MTTPGVSVAGQTSAGKPLLPTSPDQPFGGPLLSYPTVHGIVGCQLSRPVQQGRKPPIGTF
jgi:hypothetical protein